METYPSHMMGYVNDALNLDAIDQDLTDVEAALKRLDADTYFVDEITGAPLSQELMSANPTARRA